MPFIELTYDDKKELINVDQIVRLAAYGPEATRIVFAVRDEKGPYVRTYKNRYTDVTRLIEEAE